MKDSFFKGVHAASQCQAYFRSKPLQHGFVGETRMLCKQSLKFIPNSKLKRLSSHCKAIENCVVSLVVVLSSPLLK